MKSVIIYHLYDSLVIRIEDSKKSRAKLRDFIPEYVFDVPFVELIVD